MPTEALIRCLKYLTQAAVLWLVAAFALVASPKAAADTGGTNKVSGFTINYPSGHTVGISGPFNALIITNAGVVNVTGNGTIGNTSTSSNNIALVSGAGSVWNNSSVLYVGQYGAYNQLTINNGGHVFDSLYGYIGYTSSFNSVLVTDPGSVWSNGAMIDLGVQVGGNNNSLVISNGGKVISTGGMLNNPSNWALVTGAGSLWTDSDGLWLESSLCCLTIANGGRVFSGADFIGYAGSNNSALINGSGSTWSNSLDLNIGYMGSFNYMTITNGGQVLDREGFIGYNTSSGNNSVLVTGTGSFWKTTSDLNIGNLGSFNNLTITNGGQVSDGTGIIGNHSGNNSALVIGTGSVWNNNSTLYVGAYGSANSAVIANGAQNISGGAIILGEHYSSFGNSLIASNGVYLSSVGLIIGSGGAYSNSVILVSNAVWNLGGGALVWGGGSGASNNSLTIDLSSAITNIVGLTLGDNNTTFYMTNSPGGFVMNGFTTNQLQFSPSGFGALTVGQAGGKGTALVISNYTLNTTAASYIGNNADTNYITVNGPGALWENTASLVVGSNGAGNALTIANGGTVTAPSVVVGVTSSNCITVSGGNLYATNTAGNGSLDIHNGTLMLNNGTVVVNQLYLTNNGSSVMAFSAGLLRSGGGTVSNGVVFTVGDGVQSATLGLTGGTNSFANGLWVNTNAVLVSTGITSLVTTTVLNAGQFSVNGGTMSVASAFTNAAGGTFNLNAGTVLVPLQMNNMGAFVQNGGFFDPAVFTNSGSFVLNSGTNMDGVFLNLASATVLQTGGELDVNYATNSGSWTISGGVANLTNFNNLNTLILSGGVMNVSALLVTNAGSVLTFNGGTLNSGGTIVSNGSVFVVGDSGSGAALNLVGGIHSFSTNLVVGNSGTGNSLLITNGGAAFVVGTSILGNSTSSSNNFALVTGAGSVWSNSGPLYVGSYGSFNSLYVANSAKVVSTSGHIGAGGFTNLGVALWANNNSAVVTGTGSVWSINGEFSVGGVGVGNSLIITNGGMVVCSGNSCIGGDSTTSSGATNNSVIVTGPGSVWSNSGTLMVGDLSSGNNLTIANGGKVFANAGQIGFFNGALGNSVTVDGTGSVWSIGGDLNVGSFGSGYLNLTNGGTLSANNISIGLLPPSPGNGCITINGGNLYATNSGGGTLLVQSGTMAINSGTVVINQLVSTNFLNIVDTGGFRRLSPIAFSAGLLASGGATVSNGTAFVIGDGVQSATLDLFGGTHSFANDLLINTNATLTGTGAITGSITDYGLIAPGNGLGVITDTGSLTLLTGSALTMELGGTNTWLYDQFDLTGTLTFAGTLNLSLVNGYTPTAGDWFNLFDFGSSSGAFNALHLPTLAASLYWNTNALYSTGQIEADLRTVGITTPGTDVYPFTNKPAAGSGINWNRPLAAGLVSAVPVNEGAGTNFYDAVSQQSYAAQMLSGSPGGALPPSWYTPSVSTNYPWAGPAIGNNSATAQAIQSVFQEADLIHNVTNGYSYATLVQPLDTNTFGRIMDATGAAVITTYLNVAGFPGQVATTWRNAAGTAIVPKAPFTTNQWMLVLCTVQDGLGVMYVNGVPVASNTTVNLAKSWTNQTGQLVYNATGNGSQMCNANFSSWWVWNNRVLTAQEAAQMYTNPWAMFYTGSQKGFVKGTKVTLSETASINDVRFYSHAAMGDVRLALYDNASPKNLLWQSGSITNTAAGTWLTVPVTNGAPSSLTLATGTYWLAWQVDTTADVPSYAAGSSGDGFTLAQTYGNFPATLGAEQSSSEQWSLYFTYSVVPPTLLSAASRKTHGGAGTFDLNLNLNGVPSATIEPRAGGPSQLVFTFNTPMAAADGTLDATEFTLTNATFVSANIVGSNLTLNLTNVVDQTTVTVVMNGLTDLSGNALSGTNAVIVRGLYGDVNQNGSVNVVDMQRVKNNMLQGLTAANFLCDVNCNGGINVVDLQQIKNNLLHTASLAPSGTDLTDGTSLLVTGTDSGSTTNAVSASATLGDALGGAGLVWRTGGDAGWTATVAEDGSSAAWSGKIGDLNVSWMEATVTGPGTLSFDWMVSSEQGGDYLTFSIDGVAQPGAISGEVNWQTLTFNLPAGTHRLTWTYSKNGSGSSGLDAGWVRRVVYR